MKEVLKNKTLEIPAEHSGIDEKLETNYLQFITVFKEKFITGIENKAGMSGLNKYIYFNLSPYLISFGLLEISKIAGVQYRRIEMSKLGLEFLARLEIENSVKGKV